MMKAFWRGKGAAALLFAGVFDIADSYWTARVKMTRKGASPLAFQCWSLAACKPILGNDKVMSEERQR